MTNDSKLVALVELLSDERETVRAAAQSALAHAGANHVLLRQLVERLDDPRRRARARARVEDLRTRALERELAALATQPEPDLERGAFLLAAFHYPELDPALGPGLLDALAKDLLAKLPGPTTVRQRARALREFLHEERGFKGDVADYAAPENAFLNKVLERRTGIPTSLACVYLLVGRRIGVPLEGVNLPLHFVVRWKDEEGETFIDPFANGRFLTREDCREFLRGAGIEERPEFLERASDREVLSRLARCAVASFRSLGAKLSAERFERCLAIVAREAAR